MLIDDPNRKLLSVDLLLTYRCTSECSHCYVSSSTRKDDPMKLAEAKEYLKEAIKLGARSVWLFGGEPFFYFDLLLGAVESAKELGMDVTTTSNSFWATSEESALKRLHLLKEKGLDFIAFSADPFHWEYVPLEYVQNAAKAAKRLDMKYELWGSYFIGKDDDSSFRLSREITIRMLEHRLSSGPISFQGTAAYILAEHAPQQPWTRYNKCIVGRGLSQPNEVTIEPYGYVQIGCFPGSGISIGNAKENRLSEIVKNYKIENHTIAKVLYEEGPSGLAKMAMNYGFEPTEYADACHLCYEARKVLLEHYPQYLAPAIWYERAK